MMMKLLSQGYAKKSHQSVTHCEDQVYVIYVSSILTSNVHCLVYVIDGEILLQRIEKENYTEKKYFLCKINDELVTRVEQLVRIELTLIIKTFIFKRDFVNVIFWNKQQHVVTVTNIHIQIL